MPDQPQKPVIEAENELLAKKGLLRREAKPKEFAPPLPEGELELREKKKMEAQKEEGFLEETIKSLKGKLRSGKKKPTQIPQLRDELTVKIEKIMEQGLEDAYRELDVVHQQEFKIKGEETAFKIRDLLRAAHVKIKKIFRLLLEWLKMLPGINLFFLEQEAKIKTDKIITLKNLYKK